MAINSESLTELLRLRVEVRRLERDNRLLRAKLLQQQASPSAAIDRLGIELAETQEETGAPADLHGEHCLGVIEFHVNSHQVTWSPGLNDRLGYAIELPQRGWDLFVSLLHPNDIPTAQRSFIDGCGLSTANLQLRFRKKDGNYLHSLIQWESVTTQADRPLTRRGVVYACPSHTDIPTELHDSDQQFTTLFQDAGVCMAVVEIATGRIHWANDVLAALLGYTATDLSDRSWWQIMPLDGQGSPANLDGFSALAGESELLAKDGSTVWVQVGFSELRYANVPDRHVLVIIQDVTERKRAEEELRRSEAIQRAIMDSSLDSIMLLDLDGNIIFINRTAPGLTPAMVLNTSLYSFLDPADVDKARACIERVIATGAPDGYHVTYRGQHHDVTTWDTRVAPVMSGDKVVAVTAIARDETALKQSIEALQKSEQSLAKAQEIVGIGSWEYDIQKAKGECSAEMLRILGLPPGSDPPPAEEFFADFVHPDDRDAATASFAKALTDGEVEFTEFRIFRQDNGELSYVHTEVEVTFDAEGMPRRLVGTLQDVTAAKAVEMALRESEERFRALTERSPAIVFIAKSPLLGTHKIAYGNARLCEVTGYRDDELAEMDFLQIAHPEFHSAVQTHQNQLSVAAPRQRYETKIVTKAGNHCWLDISSQLIDDDDGVRTTLAICIDVTERKNTEARLRAMEAQLSHVSRLSTMGEMLAGIAHEIQQPLSAIAHFSVACQNTIESNGHVYESPVGDWLDDIGIQAVRCGDIIRRLRSFVKKSHEDRCSVNLNQVVHDSVALIRSDSRNKRVTIECQLPTDGPMVQASEIQLQQVVVNLLNNACDASRAEPAPHIQVRVVVFDSEVRILCEDNGPGIPTSASDKIFDAFFTTKEDGMGMGLAISKSIVEAHDGKLVLASRPDENTQFALLLPIQPLACEGRHVA